MNQDQVLAVYSVPPDYVESIVDAHLTQRESFANPDFFPQWQAYLDSTLTDAGCVHAIKPYRQGYDGNIDLGQGDVAMKIRVFPSVVLPPLRMSRDVTAITAGQNPEGNYGGGGVRELRPKNTDLPSAFGFTPLEGHGLIAIIGQPDRATTIVVAMPNNESIQLGTKQVNAIFTPKSSFVRAIANTSGFLNILQEDACNVCPSSGGCSGKVAKVCPSTTVLQL